MGANLAHSAPTTRPRPGPAAWLAILSAVPVTMAVLAFVVFPLFYGLWCTLTGTGLNNGGSATIVAGTPLGHEVEVFFTAKVYDKLPVEFTAERSHLVVRTGADAVTTYRFRNLSDKPVRFRPVHAIAPVQAAGKYVMRECFCFTDQEVEAHGERTFPVRFAFTASLDRRLATATVNYGLFHIDENAPPSAEQLRIKAAMEASGGIVSPPVGPL